MMPINLQELFQKYNATGLSINSKSIKANEVFFAIKGRNTYNSCFIKEALGKGAAFVVTSNKEHIAINRHKVIFVQDIKANLYEAINIFYPKHSLTTIAATGTNGKSSVVSYIAHLYYLLGKNAASIGTTGIELFNNNMSITRDLAITMKEAPELTTFDYLSLRKSMYNLTENNINYLAFEASSHGLDQGRLGTIETNIACFTSFSQDHLDYHHTKEFYLLAKLKLFTDHLHKDGLAIINSDIEEIGFIKDYLSQYNIKYLLVGINGDLKITNINSSLKGQNIDFIYNDVKYNFGTSIIGSFQAGNLLIAALAVHHTGFDLADIVHALTRVRAVKGRMEQVGNRNIFIDYAHTPDALEKTLIELKNIKLLDSKLVVVFGCGGNRDKTKRGMMGATAARLADHVIVTDDNPRHEDSNSIRAEIISGIEDKGAINYIEIGDRAEAIRYGINSLKENDILLIAGKGHENYQIIGDKKIPFDEAKIVKSFI